MNKRKPFLTLTVTSLLCLVCLSSAAQSPVDVLRTAQRTNDYFMHRYADPTQPTFVRRMRESNLWTRAVYYEGLMALYGIDPQQRYIEYTERWANHHQWQARGGRQITDADNQCCQQTYIELHQLTGRGTLEPTRENLEHQMATGRCDYWTWIDAIQMAMPVYIKMYAHTRDQRYLDYAMKSYLWTRNECGGGCYNQKEGLWWRDKDYVAPYTEPDGRNCYWSRGNGWVYAALVRCMKEMNTSDKAYKTLKKDFLAMSEALRRCQHDDGFWHASLVSDAVYPTPEMTGTALFLYGMSWGIRQGLLSEKRYRPSCDKAWRALESCLHDNGFLGWNQGTGKDPSAGQPVTFDSMPDFEDYGTGCYLLGLTEYYRLLMNKESPLLFSPKGEILSSLSPSLFPDAKAGTRWWWLGSAVDRENLRWNLEEYARAGIGTVEITPIYGVQGNDAHNLPFLSPQWMQALKDVEEIARPLGIQVDMNCGTGWPFGGPQVPLEQAACRALFKESGKSGSLNESAASLNESAGSLSDSAGSLKESVGSFSESVVNGLPVYTLSLDRTRQRVKRAAPGGEGFVVDHFDRDAVGHYLARFDSAFAASGVPYPHTFFNDSYEVYGANWTPSLFDEFLKRRGYDLRQHLPELLGTVDDAGQVLCDYRETLSDLLLENFTQQWVDWAHSHGVQVRNQAHGSPANLLDLYAAVDIPEIEGFGLSEFGIKGLRTDPGMTRKNFSDVSMLKYAPSAAHVTGKTLCSSETFTWLTEHFRTSLSQMKPDLDLMFSCGVNRVFFHGSCYTPKDDAWPGWKFYASIDMSPTNSIWRDAPFLMQYIERCQRFLQWGSPDNDFLVYLPVRDMWRQRIPRGEGKRLGDDLLMQFDIHSMAQKAPQFISSILKIDSLGYDCDYISDRQLAKVRVDGGMLVTEGGTRYRALIIPSGTTLDARLQAALEPLSAFVIQGEDEAAMARFAKAEPMRKELGLRVLRRRNPTGHHYFIANLTPNDIETDIPLAVPCTTATWYNPMTGDITPAFITSASLTASPISPSLHLTLRSGESRILQTTLTHEPSALHPSPFTLHPSPFTLNQNPWILTFLDESPRVVKSFALDTPQTWETLSDSAAVTMGTGVYTTTFRLTREQARHRWQIDLGDVRESARVYINDTFIGCAWAVPFVLDCRNAMKKGKNTLRIEVTNLPANRIRDLDRRGVKWRKFNEINVVDINYKPTTYEGWELVKSGLNSPVRLVDLGE